MRKIDSSHDTRVASCLIVVGKWGPPEGGRGARMVKQQAASVKESR